MSKGTVYTGIIQFPKHPKADMHGQLRCIVRTQGMTNLTSILRVYDIPFSPVLFNWGVWCESSSIVEREVSEKHYGRVLVCRTWQQYLKVEDYEEVADEFKVGARQVSPINIASPEELAAVERAQYQMGRSVGQHLFTPEDEGRRCRVCHQLKDDNPKHVKAEI